MRKIKKEVMPSDDMSNLRAAHKRNDSRMSRFSEAGRGDAERPAVERALKPPRMPADSFKERCHCGLGIMIWCGPRGLGPAEDSFMVEWRERHEGHGVL